jgi:potassium efflux system protein
MNRPHAIRFPRERPQPRLPVGQRQENRQLADRLRRLPLAAAFPTLLMLATLAAAQQPPRSTAVPPVSSAEGPRGRLPAITGDSFETSPLNSLRGDAAAQASGIPLLSDETPVSSSPAMNQAPSSVAVRLAQSQAPTAATDSAPSPSAPSLTPGEVERRRKVVEETTGLDNATKAELLRQFATAKESLEAAAASALQAKRWQADIDGAPQAVQQAKQQLANPLPELKLPEAAGLATADLQQIVGDAERQLSEAREELAKREADLRTRERRSEIGRLVAETQRQLDEVRKQISAAPAEGENIAVTLARRTEAEAKQIALEAQLAALKVETGRMEALGELFSLRRDVAQRQVGRLERLVSAWQQVVSDRRREEAERQAREALAELRIAHPDLRKLAEETSQLAQQRADLAQKLDRLSKWVDDNDKTLAELKLKREAAVEKVEAAGLTSTIGLMLRKQREEFPDASELQQLLRFVRTEMPQAELDWINRREQRAKLGDLDDAVRDVMESLGLAEQPAEVQRIEPLVRSALERQRDLLDDLLQDYDTYLDDLSDLEVSTRRLADEAAAYAAFIDERVLWIRSAEPLTGRHLVEAWQNLLSFLAPGEWSKTLYAVGLSCLREPVGMIVVAVAWGLLLLLRRRLRQGLRRVARPTGDTPFVSVRATLAAVGLTAAIASAWPLFLFLVGWLLSAAAETTELTQAAVAGLYAAAFLLWTGELVRQVFRAEGIADADLGWDPAVSRMVRQRIRRLLLVGVPAVFFIAVFDTYGGGLWQDSLGRITVIASLLILAFLLHHFLHPRKGVIQQVAAANPQGWLYRLRYGLYVSGILVPLVLASLAAAGYGYSAHQLAERIFQTVCLLLIVLFLRSLVARWLFIKQWQLARRMAAERASEALAQPAEQPPASSGEGGKPEPAALPEVAQQAIRQDHEETLLTIDLQLQQLLHLGVAVALIIGMWFIWSDTFPALHALDRITVWPAGVAPAAAAGEAPAPPATMVSATAPEQPPVAISRRPGTSLGDILFILLVAVVTILAGKNIPGLLEVTLLERLPLDQGARNAVTTICGYAIMFTGVVVACNAIGLRWQNIQWLAAALTVGLGFGLQEIFANFVSGLILLFERPVRVGDVITLDNTTGTVTRIRIRATTIRNWDQQELVVPNKDLITGRLLNWTLSDNTNRLVINVGVAYGSDTDRVRELMLQIARGHSNVLDDPEPLVTFETFGDSTLNFVMRCYLDSLGQRLSTIHDLNSEIHRRFARAGIEIAFPQRDIHIRSTVAPAS